MIDMIETILETLLAVAMGAFLGVWVKTIHDEIKADIKRSRERMEALRAKFERKQAE